jgi:hypothetical protein
MSWYTRGRKPDRNLEAAALGGLFSLVKALAEGKPRPFVYAATGAVGSAVAMNKHRVIDRAGANETATTVSEHMGNLLNHAFDAAERARALPPPSPYAELVNGWNEAVAQTEHVLARFEVPARMWMAMAPHERQAFVEAASRDGVQLANTNDAQARAYLQRRQGG